MEVDLGIEERDLPCEGMDACEEAMGCCWMVRIFVEVDAERVLGECYEFEFGWIYQTSANDIESCMV